MAVERMKMMNIVLPRANAYRLLSYLVLEERVEFIDARKMIDETNFLLQAAVENAKQIEELNEVHHFAIDYDLDADVEKFRAIREKTHITPRLDMEYLRGLNELFKRDATLEDLFTEINDRLAKLAASEAVLADLKPYEQLADVGVDYPLGKLFNMKHLVSRLGFVNRAAYERLLRCAEEIPPVFIDLGSLQERHLCLFVYPHALEIESDRIIRSLELEEIALAEPYRDLNPQTEVRALIDKKREEHKALQDNFEYYLERHEQQVNHIYSQLLLEQKIRELSQLIGGTEHFAYVSIWTPAARTEAIEHYAKMELGAITSILSSKEARVYEQAPTSLKNNKLVEPFEQLVYMYGVPNYNEIDPSGVFCAIYMLLFGMMFGDLGQGLVIVLAGLFMKLKKKSPFGGLLMRIGFSSTIFGFFYDSFFGYEHVISKVVPADIFIRPFDNTMTMLYAAIALGLVLLCFAYGLSIVNKLRTNQPMEAWLGKEGAVGLLLFISLLLTAASAAGLVKIPTPIPVAGLIIGSILLLFHEPIWNLIHGKRPLYEQKASDYYVENGFSLVEAFLSLLSNSLSFIRVGAFALNHVGLFVAFHTLAAIINTPSGSVIMAILGNILVLGLEGMIVFIQGLRLMYYELFSKYFVGEGRLFKPARLEEVQL